MNLIGKKLVTFGNRGSRMVARHLEVCVRSIDDQFNIGWNGEYSWNFRIGDLRK